MDLLCLSLAIDMTDSEIKGCIQEMIPICTVKGQGFCLTISGYDDDYRELWQIPEALGFMKRLCDLGFISTLELSTTCPDLLRKEYKIDKLPGFGALEVWMCATNRMGKGKNDIDRATMALFYKDLGIANRRSKEVMKEPTYRTDIKTSIKKSGYRTQIPDASIKHNGFNKDRGLR